MLSSVDVQRRLVSGLIRMPRPAIRRIVGEPVEIDGQRLDLHAQWLCRLVERSNHPPRHSEIQARREVMDAVTPVLGGAPPADVSSEDRAIEVQRRWVPIRLYRPTNVAGRPPLLVFFHGGGWVWGSLASHHGLAAALADHAGCIVVSVAYRKAPEHRFPAALEDAAATLRWVREHARHLGADGRVLAVAGDDAGGNLAAAAVHQCVREGEPVPDLQLLLYPITDVSKESGSYELFGEGFYLTRDMMHWFRDTYLVHPRDRADVRVSPLLAEDLEGMPTTHIVTAGFDVLRDEGRSFAARLRESGVHVSHVEYPHLIHGFASMTRAIPAARRAYHEIALGLRAALQQVARRPSE